MTMKTITTISTVDSLTGAYRSHVLGRALPEPASVLFLLPERRIDVQTGGRLDLCSQLGNPLMWAYTLSDMTASWWHTTAGRLHITITGRTAGGLRMSVYTGGPFAECHGLIRLARDEREGVSLDELYALAGLLREVHERGAA